MCLVCLCGASAGAAGQRQELDAASDQHRLGRGRGHGRRRRPQRRVPARPHDLDQRQGPAAAEQHTDAHGLGLQHTRGLQRHAQHPPVSLLSAPSSTAAFKTKSVLLLSSRCLDERDVIFIFIILFNMMLTLFIVIIIIRYNG